MGKSTFLAAMPNPVVLDFDDGLTAIKKVRAIPKNKIPTWRDAIALLEDITSDPGEFKTLGIDTADGLEELAIAHVCKEAKKKTLADFDWGGGYAALTGEWRYMLSLLDRARDSGLHVCILMHAQVKDTNDPRIGKYDQFTPLLQKGTWGATHKWSDAILFASVSTRRLGEEKEKRAKVDSEKRILHTAVGTGFVAGNRWSFPQELPLDWNTVACYLDASWLQAAIRHTAGEKHKEKAENYLKEAGDDVKELNELLASLREVAT